MFECVGLCRHPTQRCTGVGGSLSSTKLKPAPRERVGKHQSIHGLLAPTCRGKVMPSDQSLLCSLSYLQWTAWTAVVLVVRLGGLFGFPSVFGEIRVILHFESTPAHIAQHTLNTLNTHEFTYNSWTPCCAFGG